MNALFLKDLAAKTRRGLRGRVEAGRSGGGKCYGYDVVPGDETGLRTINATETAIVVRIFEEYAAGASPRNIAAKLNAEGIPGPTGKGWGQSTINGNRRRGTGILNNELYVGKLVWNRLRYMKDPETGKRISKLNPEKDWIVHDLPELRTIDDELWQSVKSRQRKLDDRGNNFWAKQRPRYLLSGLTKCGCCGGGFSMISHDRLGCSTARNKGTCSNRLSMHRSKLEQDVLGALKKHLMEPELCAVFCEAFTEHMNKLRREHDAATDHFRRELGTTQKKLSQMVDAIAEGAPVAPIREKMHALEARRLDLEEMLKDVDVAPPLLHPNMAHLYQELVGKLIETLNTPEHRAEATEVVRSLIDKIVLTPDVGENRLVSDLHGSLAGILGMAIQEKAKLQLTDQEIAQQKAVIDGSTNDRSAGWG
ncbi:MAG: recombinase family protein, partial [Pseudomonadota bacterium]